MKMKSKFALILVMLFMVNMVVNQKAAVALAAATPTFVQTKLEIVGVGETYQLEIKDKISGSKYSWTTSDSNVATVTKDGLVTSVGAGTAKIKCKITYPNKNTKSLSCKVTVTIPAKEIKINNAPLTNGAYKLSLGSTMDFNRDLLPKESTDKTYWSIGGGDPDCIRIDDATKGVVTAVKPGFVVLKATAAKSATAEAAKLSIVDAAVIIEVVGLSASVKSAEIVDANHIEVVFDSPVNQSTVIGQNNKLSDNIKLSVYPDVKGVYAKDPGTLTASLSADMTKLTITSTNMLDGTYGISFTNKILTTGGVAIEEYFKQMTYMDTTGPYIVGTQLDDSGMIATITFNEPINFTNFKVSNATVLGGQSADALTLRILNETSNYVISQDKKSVTINMSKINSTDYGKMFSIIISGIKDLSGNLPEGFTLTAYVQTDNTKRPQAKPLYIIRTSYNTITAFFDRAISYGGTAMINNGPIIYGVIDSKDNKKVNYTLSQTETYYTGVKKVSISQWNSYNVLPTDYSASQWHDFNVDFTGDKTNPSLNTYGFDAESGILTLNYNEDVALKIPTGVLTGRLVTTTDDIRDGLNIGYTKVEHTDGDHVIKLQLSKANMTAVGYYTFTLEQGFIVDNFNNPSILQPITINNTTGVTAELPGPTTITQSATNPSLIYLNFAHKLDKPSAETISNYNIPGVTITKAELTNNATDTGATVVLTALDGTINISGLRPIIITGVKGYNNSFTPITYFYKEYDFKDNKKPVYESCSYDIINNKIKINFDEQIMGTLKVKVTQTVAAGGLPVEYPATVAINGNSAELTLIGYPVKNIWISIDITENGITDINGNAAVSLPVKLMTFPSY